MRGRLDRHGFFGRLDPQVSTAEIGDVWQAFLDDLRVQVRDVQKNVILVRSRAATLADFHVHAARNNVSRCEVFDRWRVLFHEPLAERVAQNAALSTHPFG